MLLGEGANNPGKIYIILDGQIAITKEGVSALESRLEHYELAVLREGEIFGEVSFVDGKPSPVSFEAKTEVAVAVADLSASRRENRPQGPRNRRRKAAPPYRQACARMGGAADDRPAA